MAHSKKKNKQKTKKTTIETVLRDDPDKDFKTTVKDAQTIGWFEKRKSRKHCINEMELSIKSEKTKTKNKNKKAFQRWKL